MALSTKVVRYETALAGATVDLREETAARIKAQATAAALEEEVNAAWGVRNRTIRSATSSSPNATRCATGSSNSAK
jgi:hypothetical protein